jgi:hypothetical protein
MSETIYTVYNCTPHNVRVYDSEGKSVIREFLRNPAWVLRVLSKPQQKLGTFQDVPLVSAQKPNGFSEEQTKLIQQAHEEKAVLLTSGYAADVILATFPDFAGSIYTPDSSPASAVRDEKGQITGVRRFEVHR